MAGIYYGHDGYRELWRQLIEGFEDARLDPEEVLDLGDRFLITVELSGTSAETGLHLHQPLFQLATLCRGLVVRQDDFHDRAEALEAVGLSE